MKALSFFNVKTKKKFTSTNYYFKVKSGRKFAVAKNAGIDCWRVVPKDFKG